MFKTVSQYSYALLHTPWETLPSGVDNLEISININISIPQHLPTYYSPREGSLNILSMGIRASVCPFAVETLKRTDFGIVRTSILCSLRTFCLMDDVYCIPLFETES